MSNSYQCMEPTSQFLNALSHSISGQSQGEVF